MPNRGKFGSYEDDYLKETSKAISDVKNMLPLDDYLKAQSVVNSSVSQINNVGVSNEYNGNSSFGDYVSDGNNSGYGNVSSQKQKTLVRKMETPSGYVPGVNNRYSNVDSSFSNQYTNNNMGYSNVENSNPWLNKSGSTQTLILIFTAILVVLVVIVSLLVLKYMGI